MTVTVNNFIKRLTDIYDTCCQCHSVRGHTVLPKGQQRAMLQILQRFDLSSKEIRKEIITAVECEPKITTLFHIAIRGTRFGNKELQAFDQELTKSILESMARSTLDSVERQPTQMNQWLEDHFLYFDSLTISQFNQAELHHFLALLALFPKDGNQNYQYLCQLLSKEMHEYMRLCEEPLDAVWIQIQERYKQNRADGYIAFASYVNSKKYSIIDLFRVTNKTEILLDLMPYLKCGDFQGIDEPLLTQLIAKGTQLESVIISGTQLTHLPELPNCKVLFCDNCIELQSISSLPVCEIIACSNCQKLESIGEIPRCRVLTCSACPQLQSLPQLGKCEMLDCSCCTTLKELSELPECQQLDCSGCLQIEKIPSLPKATNVECSSCTNLRSILPLPKCTTLEAAHCSHLATIEVLPECRRLTIINCTNLQFLPAMPYIEQLIVEDTINEGSSNTTYSDIVDSESIPEEFRVNLDLLETSPKTILLELGQRFLLAGHPFPIITYETTLQGISEGIDEGGLSRDFISRLVKKLCDPATASEQKIRLNRDGFPLFVTHGDEQKDRIELATMRTIGKLLALCYQPRSHCTTGDLFSKKVYNKISLLPWMQAAWGYFSPDEIIATYSRFVEIPTIERVIKGNTQSIQSIGVSELEKAYYFLDTYGTEQLDLPPPSAPDLFDFFLNPFNRETLRNALISTANSDQYFQAVVILTYELQNSLTPDLWANLQHAGGEALHDKIQGTLDPEILIQSLTIEQGAVSDAKRDKTISFLYHWIRTTDPSHLQRLLQAITGNPTIGENKIFISLVGRDPSYLPVAHTCGCILELSVEYPNQMIFDQKLATFIDEALAGSGFQFD